MKRLIFIFFILISNISNAADTSNMLSVDKSYFIELGIYLGVILFLNKFLFQPLLTLKENRDIESSVRLERADSMEEQAIKLEDEYKQKIAEVRSDIEKSSVDRINKAKLEADEVVKNAKNKSLNKIEESRNNLQSAKILIKIESLTDKEVSEGNDDISIQIREIAEEIKVKVG
jgi:F0F1-type ATP synthase membrane subunit b/b'